MTYLEVLKAFIKQAKQIMPPDSKIEFEQKPDSLLLEIGGHVYREAFTGVSENGIEHCAERMVTNLMLKGSAKFGSYVRSIS